MKKLLAILAVLIVGGLMLPTEAEANCFGQRRVVSYTSCGQPIWAVYQFWGYDRCGNPFGSWVRQASPCNCHRRQQSYRAPHHSQGGFCNPPVRQYRGSRSGVSFHFGGW